MANPIQRLAPIIGLWNTRGETVATEDEPGISFAGTDRYEWLSGQNFILHSVDVMMGAHPVIGAELIGFDASTGNFLAQFQDAAGNPSRSQISFDGFVWTSLGDTERFDGRFSEDGRVMSGHWQRREPSGNWRPWMNVRLTKAG